VSKKKEMFSLKREGDSTEKESVLDKCLEKKSRGCRGTLTPVFLMCKEEVFGEEYVETYFLKDDSIDVPSRTDPMLQ
jgi:hypothetical protein